MREFTKIGVVVGRFQVPSLHQGHSELLNEVCERHNKVIIAVGCAMWTGTPENPLDFPARMNMLAKAYPDAVVLPISDTPSDDLWSRKLDNLIRETFPRGSVTLYGGRDSFIDHYKGGFPTELLDGVSDGVSGTRIREEVSGRILQTEEERRGAIYNAQNQYPKVYPCADMIVWKACPNHSRMIDHGNLPCQSCTIVLGKKKGDLGWRTPGGHVDYGDESYEKTAIREAREELGANIEKAEYIGSFRLEDYCTTATQVKHTSLFMGRHLFGAIQACDDLDESREFTFAEAARLPYCREHLPMVAAAYDHAGLNFEGYVK